MSDPKRLVVDGKTFCELATSRRSVFRSNEPGQSTLGLFDAQSQVLFVTTEKELRQFTTLTRFDHLPRREQGNGQGNGNNRTKRFHDLP